MSNYQQAKPKREWVDNVKYFHRLELRAPSVEGEKEMPTMQFGIEGDTPEICVWPHTEKEKGKGPIKARLNTTALGIQIYEAIMKAVDLPPGKKVVQPIEANRYIENTLTKTVVTNFIAGKRSDGVIVLGLFDALDDTRSRILFPLINTDWVGKPVVNGEVVSDEELSKQIARFYADFFRRLSMETALAQTKTERKEQLDKIRADRERRQSERAGGGYNNSEEIL